jgi:pilus assembly protein Flp/PilA
MLLPRLVRSAVQFLREEDGPTAVEYAMLLALIVSVCMGAIAVLGADSSDTFRTVSSVFGAKSGGTSGGSGGIPIGGTAVGGTSVSGGTYTLSGSFGNTFTYNATTGVTTETSPAGTVIATNQGTAGKLPRDSDDIWTRTQ